MMNTQRWSAVTRALTGLVAVGAVLASAPVASLVAQEAGVAREACRCVDPDGNEIENCTCFRSLGPEAVLARVLPFGDARARIGITVDPQQSAEDDARGARVTAVLEDGPADESGIREGDLITRIDGKSLFDPLDEDIEGDFDLDESIPVQRLLAVARALDPGDQVEIEYLRDGESRTATVETEELHGWAGISVVGPNWSVDALDERMRDLRDRFWTQGEGRLRLRTEVEPHFRFETGEGPRALTLLREGPQGNRLAFAFDQGWALMECPASDSDEGSTFFALSSNCIGGLELMELKPGLADYFGTDAGVLVVDVHEDSATGLQAGDVILGIGDRDTATPAHARRILRSYAEGEEVTFRILRRNREMTVTGRLDG